MGASGASSRIRKAAPASWWLRSPGFQEDYAVSVYLFGDILPDGDPASDIALVRPALRISLNLMNKDC